MEKNLNYKPIFFNLKLNLSQMLLANVHLGHTKTFLNIKTKPFLLGKRHNLYILNLGYTLYQFKLLANLIINLLSLRQKLLVVKDRDFFGFLNFLKFKNIFFYEKKWIGGTLTNYKKIRHSTKFKLENQNFNTLRTMRYLPSLVFFFNCDLSHWALKESSNLDIPIASIIDSDTNLLNFVNYPIVGNNKSFESSYLYLNLIKNAALKGKQKELLKILQIV